MVTWELGGLESDLDSAVIFQCEILSRPPSFSVSLGLLFTDNMFRGSEAQDHSSWVGSTKLFHHQAKLPIYSTEPKTS